MPASIDKAFLLTESPTFPFFRQILEAYHKAQVLIEALPYFKAFDEKIVVVKLGGNAMNESSLLEDTLQDIVFMEQVGIRPVVVHGGGPYISRSMAEKGIQSKFISGLRVTDDQTLSVVDEVFAEINFSIKNTIIEKGGSATSFHGAKHKILSASKKSLPEQPEVDLGHVGKMESVDPSLILKEVQAGSVPIISPLALGEDGNMYNVNADTAAAKIAESLKVEKLVFMSNIAGLLRNQDDPESLMTSLYPDQVAELIKSGVISGGMLPKVEASLHALDQGVRKVHIVDGRKHHSLLLEIFTQQGVGTQFLCHES